MIRFLPFKFYQKFLGESNGDEQEFKLKEEEYLKIKKVIWAVLGVSKYTPWKSECLVKAMTCRALIKKYKFPTVIYLGLNKENNEKLKAHAWIKCGEVFLTGGNGKGYAVVGKFTTRNDEG